MYKIISWFYFILSVLEEDTILCVHYWFMLEYTLIFQVCTLPPSTFMFLEEMSLSLPSDKLLEIQWLALSLFETETVTIHLVMSHLGKTNFVPIDMYIFTKCVLSFRAICWISIISLSVKLFQPFSFNSTSAVENVSVATESSSF